MNTPHTIRQLRHVEPTGLRKDPKKHGKNGTLLVSHVDKDITSDRSVSTGARRTSSENARGRRVLSRDAVGLARTSEDGVGRPLSAVGVDAWPEWCGARLDPAGDTVSASLSESQSVLGLYADK